MKTKAADVYFSKHFLWLPLQHLKPNKNNTINHIFKKYLVRSDEVATIKSVWKNIHPFSKSIWLEMMKLQP